MKGALNLKRLKFVGIDSWDRPVYKDGKGKLWKDVNLGSGVPCFHSAVDNEFDGEPYLPLKGEYKIVVEDPNLNVDTFQYQMLDMMRSRCDYFLGNGNRFLGHLYGESVSEHIAEMKRLWESLPDDGKPEWCTWERILEYEKNMTTYTEE